MRRLLFALALATLAGPRPVLAGPVAEAWGQGGKLAYRAGAAIMRRRNGDGVPLTAFQKRLLRPLFGNWIDRVRVAYRSQMLEEWKVGPWTVRLGAPSGGQTFGYRIYIHRAHRPGSLAQARLLAHELVHTKQFRRHGSTLSGFGYAYFKAYYEAGLSYRQNALEREAYDFPTPFSRQTLFDHLHR